MTPLYHYRYMINMKQLKYHLQRFIFEIEIHSIVYV